MRAVAAIMGAEWKSHWKILAAAAALGLVPLIVGWTHSGDPNPAELRDITTAFLGFLFGATVAVFYGATALASDLSAGRTGFYLSRPISTGALFVGKMGSVWLLSCAGAILVALPSALAPGGFHPPALPNPLTFLSPHPYSLQEQYLSPILGIPLLFLALGVPILFAHAASVALRSRAAWLLLDLSGLVAAGIAITLWIPPMKTACGWEGLIFHALILVGLLSTALLAATLCQTLRAGADLGRAHALLSSIFWSLAVVIIVPYLGFAQRAAHPPLEAMDRLVSVSPLGCGGILGIRGHVDHRKGRFFPTFALHLDSGQALLTGTDWYQSPPLGIGKNRVIFREEAREEDEGAPLKVGTFKDGEWEVVETAIARGGRLFASADRKRFGLIGDGRLSLYDSDTLNPLWSVPVVRGNWRGAILQDGRVRFRGFPEGEPRDPDDYWLLIYECGVDGRGPVLVGKQRYIRFMETDPVTGKYVAGLGEKNGWGSGVRAVLCDPATGGEPVELLPEKHALGARFLDRGIAVTTWEGGATILHLLSPDRVDEGTIDLSPNHRLHLGGQPAPGLLFVIGFGPQVPGQNRYPEAGELMLVDLDQMQVLRRWPEIRPLTSDYFMRSAPWYRVFESAGSPWTKLFLRGERELVRVDPETGEVTQIFP